MRLTATFGAVSRIEFRVPLRMEEEIALVDNREETISGTAVYTNHRLFQTEARIVGPR
jgi:hypothetical protein